MLGTAIIVFREILEAALIVSIVAAATRGLAGRTRLLTLGVVAGIAGALLVAGFAAQIATLAGGGGQSLFNAAVLLAAAVLISWHVLWMSRHGREMAQTLMQVSSAVGRAEKPPSALMVVVAIAVLREGSEIVLFIYGMAAGGVGVAALGSGGILGLAAGIAVGLALYFGLLRIPPGKLFAATNWILVLLAAGMVSHAGRYLVQADWLPTLGTQIWDSSWLATNGSTLGRVLSALVGYDARPSGIQLVLFMATLILITGAGWWLSRRAETAADPCRPAADTLS
ncbi:MAG: iron permease [Nevskiaceae bacterium]|nr:MAG: iron permease [Nevskiaceae bacterium]TBR75087.1 MAG: iron permease [Nevskiaceae bacterium]